MYPTLTLRPSASFPKFSNDSMLSRIPCGYSIATSCSSQGSSSSSPDSPAAIRIQSFSRRSCDTPGSCRAFLNTVLTTCWTTNATAIAIANVIIFFFTNALPFRAKAVFMAGRGRRTTAMNSKMHRVFPMNAAARRKGIRLRFLSCNQELRFLAMPSPYALSAFRKWAIILSWIFFGTFLRLPDMALTSLFRSAAVISL